MSNYTNYYALSKMNQHQQTSTNNTSSIGKSFFYCNRIFILYYLHSRLQKNKNVLLLSYLILYKHKLDKLD